MGIKKTTSNRQTRLNNTPIDKSVQTKHHISYLLIILHHRRDIGYFFFQIGNDIHTVDRWTRLDAKKWIGRDPVDTHDPSSEQHVYLARTAYIEVEDRYGREQKLHLEASPNKMPKIWNLFDDEGEDDSGPPAARRRKEVGLTFIWGGLFKQIRSLRKALISRDLALFLWAKIHQDVRIRTRQRERTEKKFYENILSVLWWGKSETV